MKISPNQNPLKILLLTDAFYPDEIGGIPTSMRQIYGQFCKHGQEFHVFKYKINDRPSNYLTKILRNFTVEGDLKIFQPGKMRAQVFSGIKLIQSIQSVSLLIKFAFRHLLFVIGWRESPKEKIFHFVRFFNKSMMFLPVLDEYIRTQGINLILCCSVETKASILGYYFKLVKKIPFIGIAHGQDFIHGRVDRDMGKLLMDATITRTNYTKKLVRDTYSYPANQIYIVPDGITPETFANTPARSKARDILNIHEHSFVITTVGALVFLKGVDLTLRAIHLLKTKYPSLDLRFYIIGNGKQWDNLHKLVAELKLESQVCFLPGLSNDDRNLYLSASDVLCLPSREFYKLDVEGFGIALIEANYLRVPAIGARSGGIPEAMEDNVSGFLVAKSNYLEITDRLEYFIKHPEERTRLGNTARERIEKYFLWDAIYQKYLKVFQTVAFDQKFRTSSF